MRHKLVFDIECYPDYFQIGFKRIDTGAVRQYELYAGHPLPRQEILAIMQNYTVIGFNSMDYDIPMLFYALKGMSSVEAGWLAIEDLLRDLKGLSDHIILEGLRGWQVEQLYDFKVPAYVDHIDLKEPVPGVQISLKLYMARLHSKKLQELPYDPDELVFGGAEDRRTNILTYNVNDLDGTIDLWNEATKPSDNIIETRQLLSAEFGIDLRSKSDAQIAEAMVKTRVAKLKGVERLYPSEIRPGTRYRYQSPAFLKFQTPILQKVFADVLAAEFVVDAKGGVEMPPALANAEVRIGQSVYRMGIGGLHSSEKRRALLASQGVLLRDRDVVSYYPSLILQCGLFPPNMGEHFQRVYKDFFDRRIHAKKKGDKSTAQTLKIVLNGTFGKLGSKWSVLYAPNLMIQVTVTGQLALLMLIERMELAGIPVVSANTDGIVTNCPTELEARMQEIVNQWETDTGLETEETKYKLLASRDVNSYCAITTEGKVKTKGALAPSDAQHNPSDEIVKKAVIDFLAKGSPVAETILRCRDVRQFLTVQRVTGGAQLPTKRELVDDWVEVLDRHWARKAHIDAGRDYYKGAVKRKSRPAPVVVTAEAKYLGKVVRFYHSTLSNTHIEYVKNGNKVPTSENAMPLMELDGTFPDDVDYVYYINQANALLRDLGATL